MKNGITICLMLITCWSFAGEFIFPNVEYSYAKLHQFNVELRQPSDMSFYIYKDGRYAPSKLGNGILVSDNFHSELKAIMAKGVDELVMGLGKCYMPRHGIIYYDENHQPVASLSVCFECDKISIWSKKPYKFSEDYSKFNYDKAERQLKLMEKLFGNEGTKVYPDYKEAEEAYKRDLVLDTAMLTYGSVVLEITDSLHKLPLFTDTLTKAQVKTWLHPSSKERFIERVDTMQTKYWEKIALSGLHYKLGSHFLFSSTESNATLIKAIISSEDFTIPNGLSVGMSQEQVARVIPLDNPDFKSPKRVVTHGDGFKVIYLFNHQTLTRIEIEIDRQ